MKGIIPLVLTTIVIPLIAYWWKSRHERHKALLKANEQFRTAFLPSMGELSSPQPDIYSIISRSRGPHEAAILEFRDFLPSGRRRKFDKAVNKYRTLRDSSISTATNDPLVGSKLLATMEELRRFAPPK
jgi:hypothetical protein